MRRRPPLRSPLRSLVPGVAILAVAACASEVARDPRDFLGGELLAYRLLSKDDFRAKRSGRLWGNIAHGAEICTLIVPSDDHGETAAFHAVMNPDCSFWNEKVGTIGTLGGLAGVSVVPGLPTQQPDWYVLQHEQIHFAIMQAAALRLSRQLAALPESRRTRAAIESAHQLAMAQTQERHQQFDAATSGTFDPGRLGVWVRALELEMRELCGLEPRCWVRHQTPLGWGD
jgi:hypothetical protein